MTAEEREEYKQRLLAKPNPTDRDLRHLARITKAEGAGPSDAPSRPQATPKPRPDPTPRQPKTRTGRSARVLQQLPIDGMYRHTYSVSQNMVVPWLLMAGYCYHVHNVSLLSDELFDEMCRDLDTRWDEVVHRHKDVIKREWLSAGSLYPLKAEDYPVTTRGAASHLTRDTAHPVPTDVPVKTTE